MVSPLKVQSIAEWKALPELNIPTVTSSSGGGLVVTVLEVGALLPPVDMCRAVGLLEVEPLPDSPRQSLVALPTVTVEMEGRATLYRLPHQLGHWAFTHHALLAHGYTPFPGEVEFSLRDGRYIADVQSW